MFTRFKQYIQRWLPAKMSKKQMTVGIIFGVSVGVVLFAASTQVVHADMLEDVRNGILWILTQASLLFARLCMAMAIFFLRFFIQLGAYNGFLDAPIVRLGWVMLRDIANMFFVVALLVIAFATILGRESYEWKKAMVKLVLVAILVNFSLLICGIVLDAAHVFTVTFINAIAPVAAGNLITMFNFGDMESIIAEGNDGSSDIKLALFGGAAMALFFSAMAALTIGAYCVILLYRMVAIWSLLIFSPLAFVMSVLPATESYFEEWKSEFTKNILSAPIAVFFLWLAFATMGANSPVAHIDSDNPYPLQAQSDSDTAADGAINNISGNTQTNSVSLNVASTWTNMAGFLVAMAFLLKGIEQVQSLGVRGAGWLDSAQSFAKNVAMIGSGVALGGWLLGKGRDTTINTAKNVGLAVGTQTGVVQAWKRTFTGKGLFAGAGQRAEARLERLEEEQSNKESMQKAIGRNNRTFADVLGENTLGRVGLYKTARQSLARSAVKSDLSKDELSDTEGNEMIQAELDAREGKMNNKVLPNWMSRSGGGNISDRFTKAQEAKISVEIKQSRLDAKKDKTEGDVRQAMLGASGSIQNEFNLAQQEKNIAEFSKKRAEATQEELTQTVRERLLGDDAAKVMRKAVSDADTKKEMADAQEKIISSAEKMERLGSVDSPGLQAYQERMLRAATAEEEVQSRVKESELNKRRQLLGEDLFKRVRERKFALDYLQQAAQAQEENEEKKLVRAVQTQQVEAFEKDAIIEGIRKNKKLTSEQKRNREQAIVRRKGWFMLDAAMQKIRLSENAGDAEAAIANIEGRLNLAYLKEEDDIIEKRRKLIDTELLRQKRQKIANEEFGGDITKISEADALKAITGQERAKAYIEGLKDQNGVQLDSLYKDLAKLEGEMFAQTMARQTKKAKSEYERLSMDVMDQALREEGKEATNLIMYNRKKAEEYLGDYAHLESWEEVQSKYDEYAQILSEFGDMSDDKIGKLEGERKKRYENTTQSMRKLQAHINHKYVNSRHGFFATRRGDELKEGGIANRMSLTDEDNISVMEIAEASGMKLDKLITGVDEKGKAVLNEDAIGAALQRIQKASKEKDQLLATANMVGRNRAAIAGKADAQYGQLVRAVNRYGQEEITYARVVKQGPEILAPKDAKGAIFSTGTKSDGSTMRRANAESNIIKSVTAETVENVRSLLNLQYGDDDVVRASGVKDEYKSVYDALAKQIISRKRSPDQMRELLGFGFSKGVGEVEIMESMKADAKRWIEARDKAIAQTTTRSTRDAYLEDTRKIFESLYEASGGKAKIGDKEIMVANASAEELAKIAKEVFGAEAKFESKKADGGNGNRDGGESDEDKNT